MALRCFGSWFATVLVLALGSPVGAQSSASAPPIVTPAPAGSVAPPVATPAVTPPSAAPATPVAAPPAGSDAAPDSAQSPPSDGTVSPPTAAGTPANASASAFAAQPARSSAAAATEAEAARRTLRAGAEQEHDARVYGSYGMFISSAALIGAGLAADFGYKRSYGEPMWIIGIVVGAGGALNLLRNGSFESLAAESEGRSPEELKQLWSERARAIRGARKIAGIVNVIGGAVAAGVGGAIALGLGDLNSRPKQDWSIGLIAAGGGVISAGLGSLLIESPMETAFRAAYGSDPESGAPLAFSVAPAQGGVALHLQARF